MTVAAVSQLNNARYKVADITLADFGRLEIEMAEK